MARYDAAHKEATRRRIIETAGRRFKTDGIDGSGVAVLMKDAGLTNGAFYGHFDSKDDLVATTVADQLERQRHHLRTLAPGMEGIEEYVREYLAVAHRDDPGEGCPSGALIGDIARAAEATREAFTAGMAAIADDVADRLGADRLDARPLILGVFGQMIGALQLSRSIADPTLSEAILDQAAHDVLAQLGRASTGTP